MHKEQMARWEKDNFPLLVVATNMQEQVPEHTHDFIELVIFQRGTAIHSLYSPEEKSSYIVMQGDCFAILPQEIHSFENGNRAFYYNIIFSPALIENSLKDFSAFDTWTALFGNSSSSERRKIHLPQEERSLLDEYFKHLKQELENRKTGYKVSAVSWLQQILLTILRCSSEQMILSDTSLRDGHHLLKVINLLEKSPEKHYTLSFMAHTAGMSISSFTKKFRLLTGFSPMEFLLSQRIGKAETLLKNTDQPIYIIADMCGFNNINYFIKIFRRYRQTTPAKFRASFKS